MIWVAKQSVDIENSFEGILKKRTSIGVESSSLGQIERFIKDLQSHVTSMEFSTHVNYSQSGHYISAKINFVEIEGQSTDIENILIRAMKVPNFYWDETDIISEMSYNTHTNGSYSEKYPNYLDPAFVIEKEINLNKLEEIMNKIEKANLDNDRNFDMDFEDLD